jgi:ornithine--oxo-acid transaminase
LLREVRGKGLMIGIEFGKPKSLDLATLWHTLETLNKGLFSQLITIPLFTKHKVLAQVAGHASHTVKLTPPLIISDDDCTWIENAFEAVIAESHRVRALWTLGEALMGHASRNRG